MASHPELSPIHLGISPSSVKTSPAILFSQSAQRHPHYLNKFGLASLREQKAKFCSTSAAALKRYRRVLFNQHMANDIGCREIGLSSDDDEEEDDDGGTKNTETGPIFIREHDQANEKKPGPWRSWKIDPDWTEESALSNEKHPLMFGSMAPTGNTSAQESPRFPRPSTRRFSQYSKPETEESALDEDSVLYVRHFMEMDKQEENARSEPIPIPGKDLPRDRWRDIQFEDEDADDEDDGIMDMDVDVEDYFLSMSSFDTEEEMSLTTSC